MMDLVQATGASEAHVSHGTFSNLNTLPRVPLPDLSESLARFEEWCWPLLTDAERVETKQAIEAFKAPGAVLHTALKAFNQEPGVYSWLDRFWPARYLGRRVPVSINANFIMAFTPTPLGQIERAAKLIAAAADYKVQLDHEFIPPATRRGTPLCMIQNKYLFSSTRIPGIERDSSVTPYSDKYPGPSKAKHILVVYRHRLFAVDVISEDDQPYRHSQIQSALQKLTTDVEADLPRESSVGYLTTLPRSDWALTRAELLAQPGNNLAQMNTIEQALFCLCLDESEPDNLTALADGLLHGDGGNRWFDKSVSLIVFSNGEAGINVEHCGLDGTTIVDFVDYLHAEDVDKRIVEKTAPVSSELTVREIAFSLNQNLGATCSRAAEAFHQHADNTASHLFTFSDFGASHIKTLNISPDAFVQLGFQLAHFRTKGLIGTTYESIATRHFERGRTEAMRVVTQESVDFVMAMGDASISADVQRQRLMQAADKHVERIRQCQSGQAPEQHLWQLQMIAAEHGDNTEFALFNSPGWLKMRNDYLSTSSAPSDNITVFGFGATSEQCIGTAYLVRHDHITAYLTTPASVAQQMTSFANNLHQAYRDMASLLSVDRD